MLSETEHKANEAKRLLEEIEPYLDAIEHESIEEMLTLKWEHPDGARSRDRATERVLVIRDLKLKLKSVIARGIRNERRGSYA